MKTIVAIIASTLFASTALASDPCASELCLSDYKAAKQGGMCKGPIGYIPPAEAEANYWRQLAEKGELAAST